MFKRKRDNIEIDIRLAKKIKLDYISIICYDVIFIIFDFLSLKDGYNFARTSKTFYCHYKEKYNMNIRLTKISEMWFNIFSFMEYDDYSKFSTLNFAAYKAYRKKINII